ncbi:hypothetical protein ANCDUO_17697 [Ancylostoma duodenale]|uniref:Uncharacterized protein n=1 Tax=Ancylostoma duodenale TaxID=51022 RepID=A0A0C2FZV2_9BILA|nr:hypothetical protein ANCDUO_17697 [Ancylostoma duodenale]
MVDAESPSNMDVEESRALPQTELEELKVCDIVLKRVKDIETLLVAEVAKHWRTSEAKRENFEKVARQVTQAAMVGVLDLKEKCVAQRESRQCFEQVMTSLGCATQVEFVTKMKELVECATIVNAIEEATSWSQETIVEKCTDLSKVIAQKEVELSQLQAKLVEQQREIERLRRAGTAEAREVKLDIPGKAMPMEPQSSLQALRELRNRLSSNDGSLQSGHVRQPHVNNWTEAASKNFSLRARSRLGQSHVLSSESESSEESSPTEDESSYGRVRGAPEGHHQMNAYLKYIALPEVRCFSGRDREYSWESFLEAFSMKYPRQSWSSRELKALLKAKLTDKAKAQYEALPRETRHGSFDGLVEALTAAHRADAQTRKVMALGKLSNLKKWKRRQ